MSMYILERQPEQYHLKEDLNDIPVIINTEVLKLILKDCVR